MTLRHRARVGFAALACVGLALSTAPTASATTGTLAITGDTTLTEDHLGNVVVAADGVTLDCAEHSISGGGFAGIRVDFRRGVTVRNCEVSGFFHGIVMLGASETLISDTRA